MVNQEDYELGGAIIEVERPARAGIVISVRLTPEEADTLQAIADARGLGLVQAARELLTAFLGASSVGAPAPLA
ncbi:MAG: hypothetical protein ACR2PL_08250 [Dehalococcoidia bacterium]